MLREGGSKWGGRGGGRKGNVGDDDLERWCTADGFRGLNESVVQERSGCRADTPSHLSLREGI